MGRDSRRKANPDRARDQNEGRLARLRHSPGGYVSRQTDEQRLQSAAMHEAGHIVSALALGFEVHYAIVETRQRDQGVRGYTVLRRARLDRFGGSKKLAAAARRTPTPDMLRRRAVQVLAGQCAERSLGYSDEQEIPAGAKDDEERARKFAVDALRPLPEEDIPRTVAEWLDDRDREVHELLSPLRPLLVTVADVLLKRLNQEVSGRELTALVGPGLPTSAGEEV